MLIFDPRWPISWTFLYFCYFLKFWVRQVLRALSIRRRRRKSIFLGEKHLLIEKKIKNTSQSAAKKMLIDSPKISKNLKSTKMFTKWVAVARKSTSPRSKCIIFSCRSSWWPPFWSKPSFLISFWWFWSPWLENQHLRDKNSIRFACPHQPGKQLHIFFGIQGPILSKLASNLAPLGGSS